MSNFAQAFVGYTNKRGTNNGAALRNVCSKRMQAKVAAQAPQPRP